MTGAARSAAGLEWSTAGTFSVRAGQPGTTGIVIAACLRPVPTGVRRAASRRQGDGVALREHNCWQRPRWVVYQSWRTHQAEIIRLACEACLRAGDRDPFFHARPDDERRATVWVKVGLMVTAVAEDVELDLGPGWRQIQNAVRVGHAV
jgi:hypothetical protein